MAELSFNLRGYIFQNGIEVLRRSAQTGLTALSNEDDKLDQQLKAYRQSGKFEGEHDDEGFIFWERDGILEHGIASANEAAAELRKAFAIAAYHFWERMVRSWSIQE